MILHEQIAPPGKSGSVEWLAVDAETLTLSRCAARKSAKLFIEIIRRSQSPVEESSHPVEFDLGESAIRILCECRESFAVLQDAAAEVTVIGNGQTEIPEYVLLNDASGSMPAIMHTRDPEFIAFCPRDFADLTQPPAYYRSSVTLPPEGWNYWLTDAQQEFDRLVEDLVPACVLLSTWKKPETAPH